MGGRVGCTLLLILGDGMSAFSVEWLGMEMMVDAEQGQSIWWVFDDALGHVWAQLAHVEGQVICRQDVRLEGFGLLEGSMQLPRR